MVDADLCDDEYRFVLAEVAGTELNPLRRPEDDAFRPIERLAGAPFKRLHGEASIPQSASLCLYDETLDRTSDTVRIKSVMFEYLVVCAEIRDFLDTKLRKARGHTRLRE